MRRTKQILFRVGMLIAMLFIPGGLILGMLYFIFRHKRRPVAQVGREHPSKEGEIEGRVLAGWRL